MYIYGSDHFFSFFHISSKKQTNIFNSRRRGLVTRNPQFLTIFLTRTQHILEGKRRKDQKMHFKFTVILFPTRKHGRVEKDRGKNKGDDSFGLRKADDDLM